MVHCGSKMFIDRNQRGPWIINAKSLFQPERFYHDDIVMKILYPIIIGLHALVTSDLGSHNQVHENKQRDKQKQMHDEFRFPSRFIHVILHFRGSPETRSDGRSEKSAARSRLFFPFARMTRILYSLAGGKSLVSGYTQNVRLLVHSDR